MFKASQFIAFLLQMVGQPYWYGTCVYICSSALLKSKTGQYPSHYGSSRTSRYNQDIAARKVCADCVGLIKGFFWSNGGQGVIEYIKGGEKFTSKYASNGCPDKSASGMLSWCKSKGCKNGKIATLPDVPGVLLFSSGHVGVYVGGGYAVEARGFNYGIVKTKVKDRSWTEWAYLPDSLLTYDTAAAADPVSEQKSDARVIWDFLLDKLGNAYGAAGMMGNLYAESGLRSNNLQNSYEKSLGLTDEEYTRQVDSGSYTDFASDHAGYGLAQWTYSTRKKALLDYAREQGVSIGDLNMQLGFLWKELQGYTAVLNVLKSAQTVREASDAVLLKYEKPADQSETAQERRTGYGQTYYEQYASQTASDASVSASDSTLTTTLKSGSKGSAVALMQSMLISCGYALPKYGADGSFGAETLSAVKQFQQNHGLTVDGVVGKLTYAALLQAYSHVLPSTNPQEEPEEDEYTVMISGLTKAKADEIIALYGGELSVG